MLAAAGLAAWLACAAAAAAPRPIQIGIVPKAEEVTLLCEGPCAVTDADGSRHDLVPNRRYEVLPLDEGLRVGPLSLAEEVSLRAADPATGVRVGDRRARGRVIVRRTGEDALTVIDEIPMEDYLLGVLPYEMDPAWPIEALKAQAVVARTFAYTQLGKFRRSGFDLTSDTRSQMYGSGEADAPSILRAVSETRGEVLGYEGKMLSVFYHSCCGGHTTDADAVWPGEKRTPKPLRGVKDRWCRLSPYYRWTAYFPDSEVLGALSIGGLMGSPLRSLKLGRLDAAGFVLDLVARAGSETLRVRANDFRNWIGNKDLRSTRILRLRRLAKGVEFVGSGSGHGVGLCQWGARLQAEKGRRYSQILSYYFPGATLSVIDE